MLCLIDTAIAVLAPLNPDFPASKEGGSPGDEGSCHRHYSLDNIHVHVYTSVVFINQN